jgi:Cof subfamily protein (haloacid dehalogenase superfamily)
LFVKNSCRGLCVTDLDGTLLTSDGTFAQRDLDALDTLARNGVRTAVATGRSLYSFFNSPAAGLKVDYIIFSTGAGVITQPERKLLYQVNLSSALVAQTLDFLHQSTLDFMLHHPVPENHRYVYRRSSLDNTDFESRIERYREFGQPLDSVAGSNFGEASQFLAVVPRDRSRAALREVRNGLPGLSVIHSTSPLDHESTWIEFFHPDVSKGKTAAWLAAGLGVNPVDTMAIGNDYNDLDLLEWAAHGFVVANAPIEMKSRFEQVASNDKGGVAEAIGRWLNSMGISSPADLECNA